MAFELSMDDIELADLLFEALCSKNGVSPDDKVASEYLSRTENSFPGYKAYREQILAERAEEIETFTLGSRLVKQGVKSSWYSGPKHNSGIWPKYKKKLEANNFPAKALHDLNMSTTQIMGNCANPRAIGDKRKGLVVGYVQSGKTANFEGLIAKAADAGYKVVIVLAGMFDNLREQTQARLEKDLELRVSRREEGLVWHPLTTVDTDFVLSPAAQTALNDPKSVAIAVVKKNGAVLRRLVRWLESISQDVREKSPILIVDDEADQATPNTMAGKKAVSAINQLVRDVWSLVETGTYVAYTATPFANVFMDPNDREDMYPDDFIFDLPEPEGYIGASKFFNVEGNADVDDDQDLRISVGVPEVEAEVLTPRTRNIEDYDPHITQSLGEAIRWFMIATAIRELRHGENHSSMLVHTSHRIQAHESLSDAVTEYLRDLWNERDAQEQNFRAVFEKQIESNSTASGVVPEWHVIWNQIVTSVLPVVSVVVENGVSESRLDYSDGIKKVVVVGGSTLSRGITLEGLITSFFLRTSANYDTLLQMGRWFGFRNGYDDLVRLWVAPGLLEEYAHLSRVEADMRERIQIMEREQKTPRDLALPILAHDGRLKITAANRMSAVRKVQVGLSGSRRQTIYLDRHPESIKRSQLVARNFVQAASRHSEGELYKEDAKSPSILIRDVRSSDFLQFLEGYWVSKSDEWLQPKNLRTWLSEHGSGIKWNLVLVSGPSATSFDFGNGLEVSPVVRTPLEETYWTPDRLEHDQLDLESTDVVNIRALISGSHQVLDLKILDDNRLLSKEDSEKFGDVNASNKASAGALRKALEPTSGLILLYVIDKDSQPQAAGKQRSSMDAPDHLIGLSVIFPYVEDEDLGTYYSVEIEHDLGVMTDEEIEMAELESTAYEEDLTRSLTESEE